MQVENSMKREMSQFESGIRSRVKELCRDLDCTGKKLCKALGISQSSLTSISIDKPTGNEYKRFSHKAEMGLTATGISFQWILDGSGSMYLTNKNDVLVKVFGFVPPVSTAVVTFPATVADTKREEYDKKRVQWGYSHPMWKIVTMFVALLDKFTCQYCGGDIRKLECNFTAHHVGGEYDGKQAWDYPLRSLALTCNDCNKKLKAKTIPEKYPNGISRDMAQFIVFPDGDLYYQDRLIEFSIKKDKVFYEEQAEQLELG